MSDRREKSASVAAGCLLLLAAFACLPPMAIAAIKYVVACWRMIGPLD